MKINLKIKNLFLQHQSEMFRIAFRLLNNKEEARDVVSEVFAKLMETDVKTTQAISIQPCETAV